ncbi:hypothetical protein Cgig2_014289 [Carnegiea gigantea]|uniref:Uncharacterized protein n=1 Tax=Carnegiea gigantea TaxID=171969 RepID=A0A9Q1JEK4_9CARY|nr:hypothetical protein Cgig2_014289 [Carnegiea gigantea]
MTELEELIPGARSPLKRVRNVAVGSVSDALISDRPKGSRSRTLIDEIEKNYTGSRAKVHDFPQFDVPSFSLGVSQEEKEVLLGGVVVVDSQPDSPILLCSQEDNDAFIDQSLIRIAEPDLQIPDVHTPNNTDKGKDVLVEASKRHRTRSAKCYIPLV